MEPLERLHKLTDREMQIMTLHGRGVSLHEIAKKLGISPKTVAAHRQHILMKLRIKGTDYRKLAFKLAAGLIPRA